MKRLLLARHAHAAERGPGEDDHDRSLSARGRREARALGEALRALGAPPDLVLCSPARRAVETLEALRAVDDVLANATVRIERGLYLASAEELFAAALGADEYASALLLIAHNPGIGTLADELATGGDAAARDALRRGFPAAALAVIEFGAERWPQLGAGGGRLAAFRPPPP